MDDDECSVMGFAINLVKVLLKTRNSRAKDRISINLLNNSLENNECFVETNKSYFLAQVDFTLFFFEM